MIDGVAVAVGGGGFGGGGGGVAVGGVAVGGVAVGDGDGCQGPLKNHLIAGQHLIDHSNH